MLTVRHFIALSLHLRQQLAIAKYMILKHNLYCNTLELREARSKLVEFLPHFPVVINFKAL